MGHVYTARFDSRIGLSSRGCGDHGRAVKVHKVLPGGLPAKGHPRSRALARNLVRAGEIAGRGRQAASDTLSTRDKISYLEIVQDGKVIHEVRLADWQQAGGKLEP